MAIKHEEIIKGIILNCPYRPFDKRHEEWVHGALIAILDNAQIGDSESPAAHEGYAWGQEFKLTAGE